MNTTVTTNNSMVCSDCGAVCTDTVIYERSGICTSCFELDIEIMFMQDAMEQLDRSVQAAKGVVDDLKALLGKMPVSYAPCPF